MTADRGVGGTPVIRQAIVVAERRVTALGFARALATMRRSAGGGFGRARASPHCRRRRSSTRASSSVTSSVATTTTWVRATSMRGTPCSTSDTARTRSRPGGSRSRSGTSRTTARSTRSARIARRCAVDASTSAAGAGCGGLSRPEISSAPTAPTRSRSTTPSSCCVLSGMRIDEAIATLIPAAEGLGGPPETRPARTEPWDGPGRARLRRWPAGRSAARPQRAAAARDGHHATTGWWWSRPRRGASSSTPVASSRRRSARAWRAGGGGHSHRHA